MPPAPATAPSSDTDPAKSLADPANDAPDGFTSSDVASAAPNATLEQDPTDVDNQYQAEDEERQWADWSTDGQAMAFIMPAWAHDAAGKPVPTSTSSDGNGNMTTSTDTSGGGYTYPITVSHTAVAAKGGHRRPLWGLTDTNAGNPSVKPGTPSYAGFLTDPAFKFLRQSKALPGGLTQAHEGVSYDACDYWDGTYGGQPSDYGKPVNDLAQIAPSDTRDTPREAVNRSRCRAAAQWVEAVTKGYVLPGSPPQGALTRDPMVSLTVDCDTSGVSGTSAPDADVNCNGFSSGLYYGNGFKCSRPTLGFSSFTHNHYDCSVKHLFNLAPFSGVRSFSAVNEPDLLGSSKPYAWVNGAPPAQGQQYSSDQGRAAGALAADAYLTMRRIAISGKSAGTCEPCRVAAGEFARNKRAGYTNDFIKGYILALEQRRPGWKPLIPQFWALHPYDDVTKSGMTGINGKTTNPKTGAQIETGHLVSTETKDFERRVAAFETDVKAPRSRWPTIWLSESGVTLFNFGAPQLVPHDQAPRPDAGSPANSREAVNAQEFAAKAFIRLSNVSLGAKEVPDHHGSWHPIGRNYYYEFKSNIGAEGHPFGSFDSALLQRDDPMGRSAKRPAYCVLASPSPFLCDFSSGL